VPVEFNRRLFAHFAGPIRLICLFAKAWLLKSTTGALQRNYEISLPQTVRLRGKLRRNIHVCHEAFMIHRQDGPSRLFLGRILGDGMKEVIVWLRRQGFVHCLHELMHFNFGQRWCIL
jgi:hypothetical protein